MLSVILGTSMLVISLNIADGLVTDDYSKEGLAINEIIERESKAKDMNLQLTLNLDQLTGDLTADVSGNFSEYPSTLHLNLAHPVRKELDSKVNLVHQKDGRYIGQVTEVQEQKRYVSLFDPMNDVWVLKGELHFPLSDKITISAN